MGIPYISRSSRWRHPAAGIGRIGWRTWFAAGTCRHRCRRAAVAACVTGLLVAAPAFGATFEVCRGLGTAETESNLLIPAGSLYRDVGRADDPLAAFTNDRWQMRLETIFPVVIPALRACARVLVRITSDSSVKSVSVGDNRSFLYTGSSQLIDPPGESEELQSTRGRVIDQVP